MLLVATTGDPDVKRKRKLALHSSPEQLALHSSPEQLALHSSPEQLALHSSPEPLALQSTLIAGAACSTLNAGAASAGPANPTRTRTRRWCAFWLPPVDEPEAEPEPGGGVRIRYRRSTNPLLTSQERYTHLLPVEDRFSGELRPSQ